MNPVVASVASTPAPSIASTPQPSVAPSQPVTSNPAVNAVGSTQPKIEIKGLPKLAHSISINKLNPTTYVSTASEEKERILNQEEFDKYWNQTLKELEPHMPELISLLSNVKITMGEENKFEIEAYNSFFESEFKKYKVALLSKLRDNSGVKVQKRFVLTRSTNGLHSGLITHGRFSQLV